MDTLATLATVASPLLSGGLLVWLIQRGFNKQDESLSGIKKRMDCFESSQHACQLENAKSFATKADLGLVWISLDEAKEDIAEIKGEMRARK